MDLVLNLDWGNTTEYVAEVVVPKGTTVYEGKDTYLGNIYNPITTNRYAYCIGDPINNLDLDGHRKFAIDETGNSRLGYEPPDKPTPITPKPSIINISTGVNINL